MKMIPSLFISHGSPSLAIEDNEYTQFLHELGKETKPKAMVVFTAHWENQVTTISFRDDVYETIYDFGGFSDELRSVTYPAKGSVDVASLVEQKLHTHNIPTQRDQTRGLDHGSWVVLKLLYPEANIPVVQMSVNPYASPEEQFNIGQALRDLGQEDILIIGSGGTSHNLGLIKWNQKTVEPWTQAFDDWLIEHVQKRDLDSLFQYETLAPYANLAVPRAEHFVPLFIAMGSGPENKPPQLLHRSYQYGTLSHIAFSF